MGRTTVSTPACERLASSTTTCTASWRGHRAGRTWWPASASRACRRLPPQRAWITSWAWRCGGGAPRCWDRIGTWRRTPGCETAPRWTTPWLLPACCHPPGSRRSTWTPGSAVRSCCRSMSWLAWPGPARNPSCGWRSSQRRSPPQASRPPGSRPPIERRWPAATRQAIGVKSIVAYRHGLDFDPSPPSASDVVEHAGLWLADISSGGPLRLTDPVILRFVLWCGVETALPLQLHTGYGDSDLDLRRCDPLLLTGFIRATLGRTRILLLHTYPFHRQAGYLTQMFPHVYTDIGLGVNHTGIQSEQLVAEMLEVAPFRKIALLLGRLGPAGTAPARQLAVPPGPEPRARPLGGRGRLVTRGRPDGRGAHRVAERSPGLRPLIDPRSGSEFEGLRSRSAGPHAPIRVPSGSGALSCRSGRATTSHGSTV